MHAVASPYPVAGLALQLCAERSITPPEKLARYAFLTNNHKK